MHHFFLKQATGSSTWHGQGANKGWASGKAHWQLSLAFPATPASWLKVCQAAAEGGEEAAILDIPMVPQCSTTRGTVGLLKRQVACRPLLQIAIMLLPARMPPVIGRMGGIWVPTLEEQASESMMQSELFLVSATSLQLTSHFHTIVNTSGF